MSGRKITSRLDAQLHISQMSDHERAALFRAALSEQMRRCGLKSNNQCERKRAIIAEAQRRRWKKFREDKEAERQRIIKENNYPADWTPPPKPKKIKQITRREALDIAYAEMTKIWPNGPAPHEMEAFKAWKPRDPRVQKYL